MRRSYVSNRVVIAVLSFLITNGICLAQVTLQASSVSVTAGGTGSVNISMSAGSGGAPAAVEWMFTYSTTAISGVTLTASSSVTAAGKTLTCAPATGSVKCILEGLNTTAIPSGVIAVAQFTVSASAPSSSSIGITGVVGASPSAVMLSATGVGSTLTVVQSARLSTLTCTPQTLVTPATASCAIGLTAAASSTLSITLGYTVSQAQVTMPASASVSAGASSTSFNVQVAAVTAQTSLVVTAALNGGSASFTITLQPPSSSGTSFTPIRVRAGGAAYTDPSGNVWSADTGYTGGSTYYTTHAITNTTTQPLYQKERYGNVTYKFAVPNGTHTVTLKFAELYWTKTGQRVFNVAINGTTVLSNFDIFAHAGAQYKALDESFSVPVTTGTVTIQFTTVVNNAKVDAIQIQ